MLKDTKIKRKIKKAMQPNATFCEFCETHDVKMGTASYVKQNKKRNLKFVKIFAPFAIVLVAFFGVFLPLKLSKITTTKSDAVEPKLYGELSVDKTKIDLRQISDESNVLLFNMANVQGISEIDRISPKENSSKLLGYFLQNVLYGFTYESELFAFDFDYLIRSYKYYQFLQEDTFANLEKKVTINNRVFSYGIQNKMNGKIGYISFYENGVEYFIFLRAFFETVEINDAQIITFLQNVFTEEMTNEKIDYKSE